MMKHSFFSKLLALAGVLSLSSCIVPNFSGVSDAVGREKLVSVPNDGHPKDLVVYKLGDAYYVEVQATWQHVSERSFYFWDPFQGRTGGFRFWERYNRDAPKETYLLLLSANEVDGLLQKKVAEAPDGTPTLISATEFDYARAKRCTPRPKRFPDYQDESKLVYGNADDYYSVCYRERASWAHYAMQPVSWLAWAVDIPLTVAINAPLYLMIAPVGAAEQVMIQTTGDVPWLKEEPLPGPVITPVEE
jgi:hypothetical protein